MNSSEVIDVSLRTFHVLGWHYLRLSVGPVLFCLASLAFLTQFAIPGLFETSNANDWMAQIREASVAMVLSLFVGGPLFLIGVSSVTASVTQLVSDYMLGNVPDERAAQRAMGRNLPKLFSLSIREVLISCIGFLIAVPLLILSAFASKLWPETYAVSGVIVMIGLVALVPAFGVFLYVCVVHSLAPVILVLENVDAKTAAKRSKFLINTPDYQGTGQGTLISLFFLSCLIVAMLSIGYVSISELLGLPEQMQQIAPQQIVHHPDQAQN